MAIYANDIAWPPKALQPAFDLYYEHEAWWAGRTGRLQKLYSRDEARSSLTRYQTSVSGRHEGGLPAQLARWFWGRKVSAINGGPRTAIHVPAAADVSALASDSLWSEGATFTAPLADARSAPTRQEEFRQTRLDLMMNSDAMKASLNEAGELCSALGGVYYRVIWDDERYDSVQVQPVHADFVVPKWDGHRLEHATVWSSFVEPGTDDKDAIVWRHLERHERGRILHEVYMGAVDNLGTQVPLEMAPQDMGLAWILRLMDASLDDGFTLTVLTGVDRLTIAYAPNVGRSRELRGGHLSGLGRSDYEGVIPHMNALDEVVSSWLRDVKVGRSRLFMDEAMVETSGPGRGAYFDEEAEVRVLLEGMGSAVGESADGGFSGITAQQFDIRVAEHEQTADYFTKIILRAAGLDAQDYNGEVSQTSMTATEVSARSKRSETTRDKRKRYQLAALTEISSVAFEIDSHLYPGKGGEPNQIIRGTFPAEQQIDPEKEARVLQLLDAVKAVSLETKVKRANPDWSYKEIGDEVARIRADQQDSARLAMQAISGAESDDDGFDGFDDPAQDDAANAGGARSPFARARR